MNRIPFIDIDGDVWLLADIICIGLDAPPEGEKDWEISLKIRGQKRWEIYSIGDEATAKRKHLDLIATWAKHIAQHE